VIRALLDTNVVLDYFLDRAPFAQAAAEIWRASEEGRITAFVSVLTPVNVFYVARKLTSVMRARQVVESLLASCDICAPDRNGLVAAVHAGTKDFEDAAQVASAQAAGLDLIVTRDPRDYEGLGFPVYSPAAFLEQLQRI
jgi:predicted nucleic acid-binding protein